MSRIVLIACGVLATGWIALSAPDVPPSWVQEISTRPVPSFSERVPAAVLLNEQRVSVDAAGKMTTSVRKAIKILDQRGRTHANAAVPYYAGSGKVKELRAWVIAPGGFTKAYGKDQTADVGSVGEDLYNELRVRVIHAEQPEVGSVFAYEAEVEQKTLFTQDQFAFQDNFPALQARYVLTVPSGWTASGVVLNHTAIEPIVDGSTYTWELRDLPFRQRELAGPIPPALSPRLAVTFIASGGTSSGDARVLKTWTDASEWLTDLMNGQDSLNSEMTAKVNELTAGSHTEYEKIRAIGRYVQALKYVSIQMDLARGGGFRPHAAAAVFQKQYGDCKDKANLMRALLKAAGIQSYLIALYSGDRTFVREEWPSPQQFNHAIIAVRVADQTQADTILDHPTLGRLLIFDPTSAITPVGDLPAYEQGSLGLVVAGAKGGLIRLPVTPSDSNLTEVSIDGSLLETGELKAMMIDKDHGQPAASLRGSFSSGNPDETRRVIERWLNVTGRTVQVSKIEPHDDFEQNKFDLQVGFSAGNYGQLMQGRLLMFRPSPVAPRRQLNFRAEKRLDPVVLYAETYRTHIHLKLPSNFAVDEIPTGAKLKTSFGEFSCTLKVDAGELVVTQELRTEAVTLPPEDYPEVRKFFATMYGMEQQPIVLIKN